MSGWDAPNCSHLSELERKLAGGWLKVDPATVMGPPTGLLINSMPKEGEHSKLPLFPSQTNSLGGLLRKYSRLTMGEYLGKFHRINLFSEYQETWNPDIALGKAYDIHAASVTTPGLRVVLIGRDVARAFGFTDFYKMEMRDGVVYASVPHPKQDQALFHFNHHTVGVGGTVSWAADIMLRSS